MPQLDISTYTSQIFWLVISFLTMFFIMSRFIVPKISEVINQRQRKIDDYLDSAHEFKMQAEAVIDRYEATLEKAEAKANEAMEKARKDMQSFVEQTQKDADERLAKKLEDSEKQIADIHKQAIEMVETISVDIASEIVAKIGLNISKSDIKSVMYQGGGDE